MVEMVSMLHAKFSSWVGIGTGVRYFSKFFYLGSEQNLPETGPGIHTAGQTLFYTP